MEWMVANEQSVNPENMKTLLVGGSSVWEAGHFPFLNGVTLPLKAQLHSLGGIPGFIFVT